MEEQYLERHLLAKHTYHNIWKGIMMSKKSWQQIIKNAFFYRSGSSVAIERNSECWK
jgi:hypothetical protein